MKIKRTQSKSQLSNCIEDYINGAFCSFHSPAHCGSLESRDLSELSGLDSLEYPSGVLAESQNFIAKLFGAQASWLLVNGASIGIQAALLALKKYNNKNTNLSQSLAQSSNTLPTNPKVLAARNIHKSVLSGIILAGFDIEWFEPEWNEDISSYTHFDLSQFNTQAYAAVIVTNPTYEGFYSKLPELDIPLIVDEAHGAHYHFSSGFPKPALKSGADLIIQSWHKCLGSLTQTGVLHLAHSSKISIEDLTDSLRLLQSTSPSYLLMESICNTATRLAENGEEIFARALELASKIEFPTYPNQDPLRKIFSVAGLSGYELIDIMEDHGIALESNSASSVLAFVNYANQEEEINKLNQAYYKIASATPRNDSKNVIANDSEAIPKPKFLSQELNPRQAFFADYQVLALKEAIGQISAELYAPCPPGIPLLVPGQIISPENIAIISNNNQYNDYQKTAIKVVQK